MECTVSEGLVAMEAVESGDVVQYVGEVSGIPVHVSEVQYSCIARYAETTISSHYAVISIIGKYACQNLMFLLF